MYVYRKKSEDTRGGKLPRSASHPRSQVVEPQSMANAKMVKVNEL